MIEFLRALGSQTFLQYAFAAGLLASLGCGVMGTFVVVRRIAFLAGGIAHAVLGGMGLALYLGYSPLGGALVAAVAAALIIGIVSLRAREHEDTLIGAIWAVGMALGVVFISRTPGYNSELMSYLFGNILMVTSGDLLLMAVLDLFLIIIVGLFFRQLQAVTFDEEFSRLRGLPADLLYLSLLVLAALTVVLLIRVVGLILVIALLTLPAAVAGQWTGSLGRMMGLASILGAIFTTGGLALSYGPDLPAGATIILLAGSVFIVSTIFKSRRIRGRQS